MKEGEKMNKVKHIFWTFAGVAILLFATLQGTFVFLGSQVFANDSSESGSDK